MRLIKKYGFSLTEMLVVLVVVAVLFAAIAPIFTKRRNGETLAGEPVWQYVNDDAQKNAYYYPGVIGWSSSALIGASDSLNPDTNAKVVIDANTNINQGLIQFRYGSGDGVGSGVFNIRNGNIYLGSGYNYVAYYSTPYANRNKSWGNTIAGIGAMANAGNASYPYAGGFRQVAFGADALKMKNPSIFGDTFYNVVGAQAAANMDTQSNYNLDKDGKKASYSASNIFIGAGTANQITNNSNINSNIAIGANAMNSNLKGYNNIYIGADVGIGNLDNGISGVSAKNLTANNNVVVGTPTYFPSPTGDKMHEASNNVIIGYNSYLGGNYTNSDVTAIGHYACNNFGSGPGSGQTGALYSATNKDPGAVTCIGYNSGAAAGKTDYPTYHAYDHIYLGGLPKGGFGGRGVLEVHNQVSTKYNILHDVTPTVVLNSNLVVRGLLFFTADDTSTITALMPFPALHPEIEDPGNRDKCRRHFSRNWKGNISIVPDQYKQKSRTVYTQKEFASDTINSDLKCFTNGKDRYSYAVKTVSMWSGTFNFFCPNLLSDIRLKENITKNDDGLDKILALMPYNFTFKSDKTKKIQTGVIAQDLQKVFPISVKKDKDGFLHIRWDEMFYACINAIKMLDKKIEKIASDVFNMENDVKQIKSSHKDIQKRIASLNARAARLERK